MTKQDKNGEFTFTDENSLSLLSSVKFSLKDGRIWLGENRMLLVHASGFGVLRRELIETIGVSNSRGLLTRMGYHNGAHDAQLVHNIQKDSEDPVDFILMGPQLHMLEGTGTVTPVKTDIDIDSGHFYGEYLWDSSAEAEFHIQHYGLGSEPICWTQIGYASGFVSGYMGKPILFKEVECIGQGAECCRIIGKPVEEWEDAQNELKFLRADDLTSGLSAFDEQLSQRSKPSDNPLGLPDVVGVSAGFNSACHKVRRVADTQATVIFFGESGVGKEVFARSLHAVSNRAEQPFVAVNCAAIPANLVEAELFGVERGAYTGATRSKPGKFERAQGGTLLLDEIGILSPTAQGKLLRVLQEREIERVGGEKTIKIDVRVIAATNLDLQKEVLNGTFREDLFYRLNVFPIIVPALRDRLEDIPIFMNHFLQKYSKMHDRKVAGFTSRAINAMLSYQWPGNVRELENIVERGVIMVPNGQAIDVSHIFTGGEILDIEELTLSEDGRLILNKDDDEPFSSEAEQFSSKLSGLIKSSSKKKNPSLLRDIETAAIKETLSFTDGNKSAAARHLGISRSQLIYRLSKID